MSLNLVFLGLLLFFKPFTLFLRLIVFGSSFLKNRAAKAIAKKALVGAVKTGGKYLSKKLTILAVQKRKNHQKQLSAKRV